MSYDLFYDAGDTSVLEISEYFENHPLYNKDDDIYVYENEETGVYFYFSLNEENGKASFAFNINYNRPCVFAEEAVFELEEVNSQFGFPIDDPQMEGHGESKVFSKDAFLKGWNAGNKFAFEAVKRHSEDALNQFFTMDKEKLIAAWNWNFTRDEIYENLEVDLYVSKIFFLNVNGKAAVCGLWPDAIPSLIPNCDYVMIPRREMNDGEEDMCFLSFEDMCRHMNKFLTVKENYVHFKDEEPPMDVQYFVKSLSPCPDELVRVPIDSIVEQGLW